jgi:hypothetical protein
VEAEAGTEDAHPSSVAARILVLVAGDTCVEEAGHRMGVACAAGCVADADDAVEGVAAWVADRVRKSIAVPGGRCVRCRAASSRKVDSGRAIGVGKRGREEVRENVRAVLLKYRPTIGIHLADSSTAHCAFPLQVVGVSVPETRWVGK